MCTRSTGPCERAASKSSAYVLSGAHASLAAHGDLATILRQRAASFQRTVKWPRVLLQSRQSSQLNAALSLPEQ
eukprot:1171205-Prymnesium_polylepis.1